MTASELSLGPPRGMRDFYPEDLQLRNFIFDAWRRAARCATFLEYDACVVESLDLLKRKNGEEIVEQIYAFTDKSGRELALRPEMTPTLARMVAARHGSLSFPIKWSTIAQCFRYERMSRGRKREHYQWNLDIVGEPDVSAEIEIIATAITALRELGLSPADVSVHCNSRAILVDLLARNEIPAQYHPNVFLVLDKIGKIEQAQVTEMLSTGGLDTPAIDRILALLQIKSIQEVAGSLGESAPSVVQFQRLLELAGLYGIASSVQFDISVVRGLNYYTGVVFEAFDIDRQFRAIFGGGRYDNLMADIGGKALTAVGMGFGDVVIAEILAEKQKLPPGEAAMDTAIGFMEPGQHSLCVRIAAALRLKGQSVDLALRPEKAKTFFSRMGKRPFQQAIYLGPDDVAKGVVCIKDLATRQATEVPVSRFIP